MQEDQSANVDDTDYLPRLADRVLTEMLGDHAAVLVTGSAADSPA